MTLVGHCLAGLTIGTLAIPRKISWSRKVRYSLALVLAANLPDMPLPCWGHDRYDISHSLLTTLAGVMCLGAIWRASRPHTWPQERMAFVLFACAWLSHLFLDTMYNHGQGLALFWPISNGRVALPIPWFETLKTPFYQLNPHSLRVYGLELLSYGLVLLILFTCRQWYLRRKDLRIGDGT